MDDPHYGAATIAGHGRDTVLPPTYLEKSPNRIGTGKIHHHDA
jgi:hypothetical protein